MKIVAVSDLHGFLPDVPPCDLLIVAGDLCPDKFGNGWPDVQGQRDWLKSKFTPWRRSRMARAILVTFGNHDFQEGQGFAGVDTDRLVRVFGLRVWLSPWSNTFGGWAFMKSPTELAAIYERIPDDVDIIVSHQPPYGYGDTVDPRYVIGDADPHCGSKELLATIDRVKPRIVICGHIHGGFGKYQHGDTTIYNVSVVNEQYQLVNAPTVIEVADREARADRAIGQPTDNPTLPRA